MQVSGKLVIWTIKLIEIPKAQIKLNGTEITVNQIRIYSKAKPQSLYTALIETETPGEGSSFSTRSRNFKCSSEFCFDEKSVVTKNTRWALQNQTNDHLVWHFRDHPWPQMAKKIPQMTKQTPQVSLAVSLLAANIQKDTLFELDMMFHLEAILCGRGLQGT